MKIAILCPGLSLQAGGNAADIRRCHVVISVNRAVLYWPSDFWVTRDLHTFLDMEPPERVQLRRAAPRTIVTTLTVYGQICRQWPQAASCSHIDPGNIDLPKRTAAGGRVAWTVFSSTTAIALAAELLAGRGPRAGLQGAIRAAAGRSAGPIAEQSPGSEKCPQAGGKGAAKPLAAGAGGPAADPVDLQPGNQIICFGMDLAGDADWDGHRSGKNCRTAERWERESRIFGELIELLAGNGIELKRMLPDPPGAQPEPAEAAVVG